MRKAITEGIFDAEVAPVEVPGSKGPTRVTEDEEPSRFNEDKLRTLKPAFAPEGTVTAGNASSVNDGEAALLIVSDARCASLRLKPLAHIVAPRHSAASPMVYDRADQCHRQLTGAGHLVGGLH